MLKAGFARLDVTPPLGTTLTGYFYPRISDGVLDPIYLNAIAINDGDASILVITGDFMYIKESFMTDCRVMIEKETGVDKDHILIQSVHQHTSTTPGGKNVATDGYIATLYRKFVDVAVLALDDMEEAVTTFGQQETAEPIAFIRRFWMKDGSLVTNPMPMDPNIVGPNSEADNTVRVIKFARSNKKDIALVQFQTHPDVIGGNKFSADWPGFVRNYVEAGLPDVSCMLLNGVQGDVNHYDITKPRFATLEERYAHSKHMGKVIADAAIEIWDKTTPVNTGKVTGCIETLYMPTNTNGIENFDACMKIRKDYEAGKLGQKLTVPIVDAFRVTDMLTKNIVQKVPVTVLSFGEIAIIGFPGEPFMEYAAQLRKAVSSKKLLFACVANGDCGYFPSASAYAEGGYEATTATMPPQIAPALHETALKMLNNL